MKILYVGNVPGLNNIEKYYLTEQRLLNGFTRLGHTTFCFNDRDQAKYHNPLRRQRLGRRSMNEKLINSAEIYKPDLLVLSHCKNVHNQTLMSIKQSLPNVKILYTNVDPLSDKGNEESIKQRLGVVDAVFVTTAGEALNKFADTSTSVHYFPNPVDSSIDTNRSFESSNHSIDLLLLGRALRHQKDYRHELAEYIISQNNGVLRHYIGGVGINERLHYGSSYFEVLGSTRMGISLSKVSDYYLYASDRLSHYLASGICTFIPVGSNFEDILGEGSFVSFESPSDLWEKAVYLTENDSARVRIAKQGYKVAHDRLSTDKVVNTCLKQLLRSLYHKTTHGQRKQQR